MASINDADSSLRDRADKCKRPTEKPPEKDTAAKWRSLADWLKFAFGTPLPHALRFGPICLEC